VTDYALVPLIGKRGSGKYVKVSPEDFPGVNEYSWRLHKRGYAVATIPGRPRNRRTVLLHHFLMGNRGINQVVDHINRDRLDNRRENLRFVNRQEHALNRNNVSTLVEDPSDLVSPRPSVYFCANKRRWIASFRSSNGLTKVGHFMLRADAENAAIKAAKGA